MYKKKVKKQEDEFDMILYIMFLLEYCKGLENVSGKQYLEYRMGI